MSRVTRQWAPLVLLWICAIACYAVSIRLRSMGGWLPTLPDRIGDWEGTDIPLSVASRRRLGDPQVRSRSYRNSLGETVSVTLVAPSDFLGFGELAPLVDEYRLLAQKQMPGSGDRPPGTATLLENFRSPGLRAHALRWLEMPDGSANPFLPNAGNGLVPRLRRGFSLLLNDPRACIVHVLAMETPGDAPAVQVRRNLEAVALGIRERVRKESVSR